MIIVADKKRRIVIILLNIAGAVFYPLVFLLRKKWKRYDKIILSELEDKKIKKVVINLIDRLGDSIFALQAIKALKVRYPHLRLILLASPLAAQVYKNNPDIDEIIVLSNSWIGKSLASPLDILRKLLSENAVNIKKVRRLKADLMIDMKGDFRNILFFDFWCSARYLAGYALSGFGWMLDLEIPYKQGLHEIDVKLEFVYALGCDQQRTKLELFFSEDEIREAAEFLESRGIGKENPFAVLHLGATWEPRRWPLDRFIEIAGRLEAIGYSTVVVGGQEEEDLIREYLNKAKGAVNGTSLSIRQVGAVMSLGKFFLGNDSGPLHLARASGAKVIGIFGPEKPERVGPERDGIAIRHEFPCSPCGQTHCVKDSSCVQIVTVEEVWRAVISFV